MKLKKTLFLTSAIALSSVIPLTVISCSKSNNDNNPKIEELKKTLDKYLDSKKDILNIDSVIPRPEFNNLTNLFNVLQEPSNVSIYFEFDDSKFDIEDKYMIFFDFNYGEVDSFGNLKYPFLNSNRENITIPIFVSLYDVEQNIKVSKYINLFTLEIVDTTINESIDEGYNGVAGRQIMFSNSVMFKPVPKIMVDKYLDFISLTTSENDWKKKPYYPSNSDFSEWDGKTLTEVSQMTNAIKPPANYYTEQDNSYKYSISKTYFNGKDERYATFVMKMALDTTIGHSQIIKDANEIYNLSFEKEYTVDVFDWAFALPTQSDISNYRLNNEAILKPLLEAANNNVLLYLPSVLIPFYTAKEKGAEELVKRFNRGARDFKAPEGFYYVSNNGQGRDISFEIASLSVNDTNKDVLNINIKMIIDKGKLSYSSEYTKKYNVNLGKFQ